ncbi:hypothetical protein [Bradyrhizobium commune]|nr:hypothetical protein [Bradyrhizobium commune]
MLLVEQMAVTVQYSPCLDFPLLMQRCDHASDDVVELVSQAP